MPLEVAQYIHQLNPNYPDGDVDTADFGDDQLRLIKQTLLNTFSAVLGNVTASHTEINFLTGTTTQVVANQHKNVADGVAGLDSAARILSAQMPTDPQFTTVRISSTVAVSLSSSGHGLTFGASTAQNLAVGTDTIQSRLNGALSTLSINPLDGRVNIGKLQGTSTNFLFGLQTYIQAATTSALVLRNTLDGSPALGSSQAVQVLMQNGAGTTIGSLGFPNDTNLRLWNQNNGGGIQLRQTNAGGSGEIVLLSAANDATDIYYQGAKRLGTAATGASIYGSVAGADGGSHTARLNGYDSAGIERFRIGYNSTSNLLIDAYNTGASRITFRGQNSAGSGMETLLDLVADGAATLYHNDSAKLATSATGVTVTGAMASDSLNINGISGDFTRSLGTAGYQKLPGGLTIQWGQSSSVAHGATASVTFSLAFTTLYQVTATFESAASTGTMNLTASSTTGASWLNQLGVNGTVHYIAIGLV